ncbi:MAG: type II toxin-antitoxin system prevent-host-death family antitoxin [Clostridiales bacterium]|nr:type II toxin-antitoxin system prevent-host-death family antitoxin [Clostridiales bacterium]
MPKLTTTVNIQDAKANLSKLIRDMNSGNKSIVSNRGSPVARLEPVANSRLRPLGFAKGCFPPGFFDSLPEEELLMWDLQKDTCWTHAFFFGLLAS